MTEEKSSYRQIMKATSLFGGVQIFNILISIVRSKFVAVLLGASGTGIMGLLSSTLGIVSGITNFGIGTSAVKDVAAAKKARDDKQIAKVASVLRRMVWVTGIFGTLSVIVFYSWLSQVTFGNKDYTYAFIWISITLLLGQLSSGQLVLLQGMQKLKLLAKANLLGSAFGLFLTIPLYYFFGVDGIVPGIIGTSVISFLLSWYYSRKIEIEPVEVTIEETITVGKKMLSMGFLISMGGLLSNVGAYLIRIFISQTGGVEMVGFYHAGFALINMYMGIVLQGMSADYYPRLSAVAHDNELCKQTINKQTEIGLLVLSPLLITFIVFVNLAIIILYSKEFTLIKDMVIWASLGMFFRVPSWSLSFVFLVKREGSLYFYLKLLSETLLLGLSVAGYYLYGLEGLGISILVMYPTYLFIVYKINNKRINFSYDPATIKLFVTQFSLGLITFFAVLFLKQPFNYIVGAITIPLSCYYSFVQLEKRLGIMSIINKYVKIGKRKKSLSDSCK